MKPKKNDIYFIASGLLKLVLVSIVSLFLEMSSSTKTFSNKKLAIEVKQMFEGTETTKYSHNVSLDSLKPQE
jgi:hypothetical protein